MLSIEGEERVRYMRLQGRTLYIYYDETLSRPDLKASFHLCFLVKLPSSPRPVLTLPVLIMLIVSTYRMTFILRPRATFACAG